MEDQLLYKSIGKVRLLSQNGSIIVEKSIQSSVQEWVREEGASETLEKSYPNGMIFNFFLLKKITNGIHEAYIALETQLNKEFFLLKLDVNESATFLDVAYSGQDLGLSKNIFIISPVLQLEFV